MPAEVHGVMHNPYDLDRALCLAAVQDDVPSSPTLLSDVKGAQTILNLHRAPRCLEGMDHCKAP
jgi:hypothetical protein